MAARRTLTATICLISVSLNPAVVHSHYGGTPRRNASLAFHLKRLQKFQYGIPHFQKVPVWRSGVFRLSLSTDDTQNSTKCLLYTQRPISRTTCVSRYQDNTILDFTGAKVKVHTPDIAPLCSESPPQKHSGMARVLKGFHSFTCTPTRSSAIGMSHTCLCLHSCSWYSFTNPGGMEG